MPVYDVVWFLLYCLDPGYGGCLLPGLPNILWKVKNFHEAFVTFANGIIIGYLKESLSNGNLLNAKKETTLFNVTICLQVCGEGRQNCHGQRRTPHVYEIRKEVFDNAPYALQVEVITKWT